MILFLGRLVLVIKKEKSTRSGLGFRWLKGFKYEGLTKPSFSYRTLVFLLLRYQFYIAVALTHEPKIAPNIMKKKA